MSDRPPRLVRDYLSYLEHESAARFIASASASYTTAALERLLFSRQRVARRAAALALGFLADFASNRSLARALHDDDRGVRMLADHGLRELWCRDGSCDQQLALRQIIRLNVAGDYLTALRHVDRLAAQTPWFVEVRHQRARALFHLEEYHAAIDQYHGVLEGNPYHFVAAVGLGNGYLQLEQPQVALVCFRRALKLNPGLDGIRAQVHRLKRIQG